eukprot:6198374-Pleurochrysis_carterae.AAC.2
MQHPPATIERRAFCGHWLRASIGSMRDKSREMSGLWAVSLSIGCNSRPRLLASPVTDLTLYPASESSSFMAQT